MENLGTLQFMDLHWYFGYILALFCKEMHDLLSLPFYPMTM